MSDTENFFYINIRDYLGNENDEKLLNRMISGFSCPMNHDVEEFLWKNAIEFTKKSQSVTYPVFSADERKLVGYFTVAVKPLSVNGEAISKTTKRKLLRISEPDSDLDTYNMSAYLIAQLAKNHVADNGISGSELIGLALTVIRKIQYMAGGVVVFLEAEPKEKLISFYSANRFQIFFF